jgi:hypothetical protein
LKHSRRHHFRRAGEGSPDQRIESFLHLSKKIEGEPIGSPSKSLVFRLSRNDVYDSATTLDTELNGACRKSEQSVVLAAANVYARVEVGATLTNDDFAGVYNLTCVTLDA